MIQNFPATINSTISQLQQTTEPKKSPLELFKQALSQVLPQLESPNLDQESEQQEIVDISHSSLAEKREKTGSVVQFNGTISDMLEVELFTSTAKSKDTEKSQYILFNDQNIGVLSQNQPNLEPDVDSLMERELAIVSPL